MQNKGGRHATCKQKYLLLRLLIFATTKSSPEPTHRRDKKRNFDSEPADFYKALQARKAILAEYRENIVKLIKDEDRCASFCVHAMFTSGKKLADGLHRHLTLRQVR